MKQFLICVLTLLLLPLLAQPVRSDELPQNDQLGNGCALASDSCRIEAQAPPQLNTLLIQFEAESTSEERDTVIESLNGRLIEWIEPIHVAKVALQPQALGTEPLEIQQAALASPQVTFYERDAVVQGAYTPNDPAMHDWQKGYGHQIIELPAAWDFATGHEEILIAIVDSGINTIHPELVGRIVGGYDFVNDDSDPTDDHGHGSHVSGLIGAEMDNQRGTTGVCPKCRIMPIKVLDEDNFGTWATIVDGIIYATDQGARVINVSLGGETASKTVEAAIEYAESRGVLIVAAAGNSRSKASFYPAAYPGVLAVGATDIQDEQWYLSNQGSYIDVSAPGHLIFSTSKMTDDDEAGYAFMSGTSMAAPYVSGLAGLLFSQDPSRTPQEVTELILSSVDDLGPSGWDAAYGHGRINAVRALIFGQIPTFDVETEIYLPLIRTH